jgi:hypothetical protein
LFDTMLIGAPVCPREAENGKGHDEVKQDLRPVLEQHKPAGLQDF